MAFSKGIGDEISNSNINVFERLKVTVFRYSNVDLVDWCAASVKGFYFLLWNVIYIYLIKI
ncbi:hypothetical protein DN410_27175 [Bacillus sp. SH5-2]|nr:hypothetical protein DN410_27175 [Bacillus sp. SH5-2]